MKLLVLDASGPVCGTAVMEEEHVLCEHAVMMQRGRTSSRLMGMVDAALEETGLALGDIDAVAVVIGPGSFTGVRIGVSTAKGLCHASGKPCVAVNALEAQAECVCGFEGIVCPIFDAHLEQVYGAAFLNGMRLMPDVALTARAYAERICELGERFLFTGSGVDKYSELLSDMFGTRAIFAPVHARYLSPSAAGSAALRAAKRGEMTDYTAIMPVYLRPPNAAQNRELIEAMHRE